MVLLISLKALWVKGVGLKGSISRCIRPCKSLKRERRPLLMKLETIRHYYLVENQARGHTLLLRSNIPRSGLAEGLTKKISKGKALTSESELL